MKAAQRRVGLKIKKPNFVLFAPRKKIEEGMNEMSE